MGSVLTDMWRRLRSIWPSWWWRGARRAMVGEAIPQERRKVADQPAGGSSESVEPEAVARNEATAEQKEEVGGRWAGEGSLGEVDSTEPARVSGEQGDETPGGVGVQSQEQDGGAAGPVEEVGEQGNDGECGGEEEVAGAEEEVGRRRRRRRRKPVARGGARRESQQDTAEDRAAGQTSGRSRVARARIVCRKSSGRWGIAVTPAAGVVVRGESDGQSAGACGDFTPADFRNVALIEDGAGGGVERVPLYVDEPMVFRLGADWQGEGRKVSGVGVGHFIVIAPSGWTRLGEVPVDPEACVDMGYRAHYFFGSRGGGRRVEGFEEATVSSSVIVLNGDRVFDDSDQGELFVGKPPVLEAPGMAVARVGEEGKEGWGETFGIEDGTLLADVLAGREGWFFVRVYREGAGVEADSAHFRYMADLREIRMDGEAYTPDTVLLPRSYGHVTTDVEIVVDRRTVAVAGVTAGGSLELDSDAGHVVCPADPEARGLHIKVAGERGIVDVMVDVPRVWWRLSVPGETAGEWLDQAPRMSREEFRTLGLSGAEIWIDVPDRVRRVGVGFRDDGATNYRATKNGRRRGCLVPVGHFVDHAEIDRRLFADAALSARFADGAVDLVEIAADAMPRIVEFSIGCGRVSPGETVAVQWRAEDCEGVIVSLAPGVGQVGSAGSREIQVEYPTTVTLTLSADGMVDVVEERVIEVVESDAANGKGPIAQAKALGGWRPAKGFSLREVSAVNGAADLPIRVDRRRRSEHAVNVALLERCLNEQR